MISINQQYFLLELLFYQERSRKELMKKIRFANDSSFFKQLKQLIEWDYVKKINHDKNKINYALTPKGWAFANILGCQKNTPRMYRKISKEIRWVA